MTDFKMKVIPQSDIGERPILKTSLTNEDFVFVVGEGDTNYLCGSCGRVICKNVIRSQIKEIVFICPSCNSHNLIKGT